MAVQADGVVAEVLQMADQWLDCQLVAAEEVVTCQTAVVSSAVVQSAAVAAVVVVVHAAGVSYPDGTAAVSYVCSCNAASGGAAGLQ